VGSIGPIAPRPTIYVNLYLIIFNIIELKSENLVFRHVYNNTVEDV